MQSMHIFSIITPFIHIITLTAQLYAVAGLYPSNMSARDLQLQMFQTLF